MKKASAALRALFNSRNLIENCFIVDLYHFKLISGQDILVSSGDVSVVMPYKDSVIATNPVAYWPLLDDETTAVEELDHRNRYDGVSVAPALETTLLPSGESSGALQLVSASSASFHAGPFLPSTTLSPLNAFSFAWWMRVDALPEAPNSTTILHYSSDIDADEYFTPLIVNLNSNGGITAGPLHDISGPTPLTAYVSHNVEIGDVHHFAVSFDFYTGLSLYVDGVLVSSHVMTNFEPENTLNVIAAARRWYYGVTAGARANGLTYDRHSDITIQHLAMYEHALDQNDATTLYQTGATPYVFLADSLRIDRGSLNSRIGLDIESLDITISYNSTDELEVAAGTTVSMKDAINNGAFAGAEVSIYRAFNATVPQYAGFGLGGDFDQTYLPERFVFRPSGCMLLSRGIIDKTQASGLQVSMEMKSVANALIVELPRHKYKSGCSWSLFSKGCGVKKQHPWNFATSVKAGSTKMKVVGAESLVGYGTSTDGQNATYVTRPDGTTKYIYADGFFTLGTLVFVTGKNAFVRRPVKNHVGAAYELFHPLPYEPKPGDSFYVLAGCDKTLDTCRDKFDNSERFRGFPYVPADESRIGLPIKIYDVRDGWQA